MKARLYVPVASREESWAAGSHVRVLQISDGSLSALDAALPESASEKTYLIGEEPHQTREESNRYATLGTFRSGRVEFAHYRRETQTHLCRNGQLLFVSGGQHHRCHRRVRYE